MYRHNCHNNAESIRAAGADLSLLTNAYCTELDENGSLKAEHVDTNMALYKRANGLLAAVTGVERYVSIGCGHTSQFCKLAHSGGDTTRPRLQLPGSKKISLEYLSSDVSFAKMINEGWEWNAVKSCVDSKFPKFATIAQRALNTRNSTN